MSTLMLMLLLLQGGGLSFSASSSPPLGMSVHVEPLDSSRGQTVRAHFTAVVTGPCASVTGLCAAGDDCLVETNTVPFTGSKPGSGWCSHQWQKTVAANFRGPISLGSSTEMYVALKAEPVVRANNGKLNHPAFVALPPPLRVREKCPHHFPLSVRDLDGDRVRCRFAKEDQGECVKCPAHSFVELDQEKCSLSFTGDAAVGLYHVFLMVEDLVPAPQSVQLAQSRPMSAVPFILSLSVEKAQHRCSAEPMTSGDTLDHNSVLYMLPFHQKSFTVNYDSNQESVTEIAVIGPPELYRTGFLSLGPVSSLNIAWVRSVNQLARLLPVCFVANTANLQSDPRCVWLYQREMMALPTGTELNCGKAEMSLALPISSFSNIDISELQLNSPTCPITYNATYLTARIPLEGCGTKTVHSGDEMIYTNTLQTVRTYSKVIRRQPVLVLPLACRIPGIQAKGPKYEVGIPKEKEVFGEVEFKLEFHFPGQGPLGKFTRRPVFRRVRRELQEDDLSAAASDGTSSSASTTPSASNNASATTSYIPQLGSKIDTLDLYVTSNCTVSRAEMLVSSCIQSETEDFTNSSTLLDQGCASSKSAIEMITTSTGTRVYRLDLSSLNDKGSTMYVRCTVNLCITTLPSSKCPDLCTTKLTRSNMVNSVFSSSYTITSPAVSLIFTTTAAPTTITTTTAPPTTTTTTTTAPTTTAPTTTSAPPTTASHAPDSGVAVGEVVALVCVIVQRFI